MKRILIATFTGAAIAFLWSFISWQLLPWHQMESFKDEAAFAESVKANAPAHGLYMLPAKEEAGPDTTALREGPFVYAVVRPGKLEAPWKLSTRLIRSYGIHLLGSLIIVLAVYRIRASRYLSRVSIGTMMGLFAGLTMTLPHGNWFELPSTHVLVHVLDPLIAWTLASLCIAAIIKPPRTRRIFSSLSGPSLGSRHP